MVAKTGNAHPRVVIIAGPNGAGKSTIAGKLLTGPLRIRHFVNADVIARGLSGFDADAMAIAAGKIMLTRLRELARDRESFAFETTLASRSFAPWLRGLINDGYDFHLLYLWLPRVDSAIARVRGRVAIGGHGIPESTIERRYYRGMHNFFALYKPLAHRWRVYNNSGLDSPIRVASGGVGKRDRVYNADQWRRFSTLAGQS